MSGASPSPAGLLRQRSVLQLPGTDRPTGFALPSFVPITEALWVADKERSRCRTCNRSFNLIRRKHHCRGCAEIFCEDCSNFKLCTKLGHEVLHVRVCGACFQQHGATEHEEEQAEQAETVPVPVPVPVPVLVAVPQQAEVALAPVTPAPSTSRSRAGSMSTAYTRSPPPPVAPMEAIAEHAAPAVAVSVPSAAVSSHSSFLMGAVAGASLLVIALCMVEALPWHTMVIVPLMGGGVFLVKGAAARSALTHDTAARPSRTLSSTSPSRCARANSSAVHHEPSAPPSPPRPRASSHHLEPHSASLPDSPTPRRPSLSSSASFPGGLRLSFDAELASLRLTPEDEQLVRLGRENLEIVERYAAEHDGWRTKRITRPDGSGSVNVQNPQAQVDFDTLALTTSNTILVQCRQVATRNGGGKRGANPKNTHLAWKSVGLVQFSPEYLFRLLFDQDNQCSWNKSLLQSRILRTIHGSRTSVTYVVSAPAVGGAVSSRDFVNVHEWNRTEWVDAEGRTHTDYTFAGGGLTQEQYAVPLNPAFVRGMSGPSGYVMRSIMPPAGHAAASDPAARWTQFVLLLDTDVKGWIPKSLTDGAMPDVAVEWITNFRQALAKRVELNLPMSPMATDVYS